jgi:hypothetical protein
MTAQWFQTVGGAHSQARGNPFDRQRGFLPVSVVYDMVNGARILHWHRVRYLRETGATQLKRQIEPRQTTADPIFHFRKVLARGSGSTGWRHGAEAGISAFYFLLSASFILHSTFFIRLAFLAAHSC